MMALSLRCVNLCRKIYVAFLAACRILRHFLNNFPSRVLEMLSQVDMNEYLWVG